MEFADSLSVVEMGSFMQTIPCRGPLEGCVPLKATLGNGNLRIASPGIRLDGNADFFLRQNLLKLVNGHLASLR